MQYLVSATLIAVGIIHLFPLAGVAGLTQLARLYGVQISDPNLQILMQHRAVLFGLIGGLMIYAAFNAHFQNVAFIVGLISVISFMLIASQVGGYNAALSKVMAADLLALVLLLVGIATRWFSQRG